MTFISFVKSFTPQSELRGKRKTKSSLTIKTSLIKPSLLTRIVEISRFGNIALIFCRCAWLISIKTRFYIYCQQDYSSKIVRTRKCKIYSKFYKILLILIERKTL